MVEDIEKSKNRPFGRLIQSRAVMSFGAIFCCALWGISTPIVKMGYRYVDAKSIPALLLWIGLEFVFGGAITLCVYGVAIANLLIALILVCDGIVLWGTGKDKSSETEQRENP